MALSQSGSRSQSLAVLTLMGGGLVLVSMFTLSWVDFGTVINLARRLLGGTTLPAEITDRIGNPQLVASIQSVIGTRITGWTLANDVPTVGEGFQFSLFFIMACGMLAILTGILGLAQTPTAKLLATIQTVASGLGIVTLIFSFGRIRALGLDPLVIGTALQVIGVSLGMGVWLTLLGLLISAVSAGLLISAVPAASTRRGTRPKPRPTRAPRRRP